MPSTLLGVLPDGAGVQDDDLGLLLLVGEAVAHLAQIAPDALRVGLVLLAAVGVYKGQGLLRPGGVDLGNLPAKRKLAVDVRLRDGGGSPFHVVLPGWIFGLPFRAYSPKRGGGADNCSILL